MQNRHDIETVDCTLRDIHNKDTPFGGITVLFGGMYILILNLYRLIILIIFYFRRLSSDFASCFTRIMRADCCSFISTFTIMASHPGYSFKEKHASGSDT